ncbi:MAG TPA: ABC transporter permease [Anaerolineales bacterium]
MSTETQTLSSDQPIEIKRKTFSSTLVRVSKYTGLRLVTLFVTIVIGIYLTILIANMGGFVDEILRGEIRERISIEISINPVFRDYSVEERSGLIDKRIAQEEERLGLNRPFALRSFSFLSNALTLNLGRSLNMTSDTGSKQVKLIILERLPSTLLLFGIANLSLFFSSVFIALGLSRHYGSLWDKIILILTPTSAAPPWFYGLFLILIFAALFQVLPFGGMVSAPPPENWFDYSLSVLEHLILPVSALILASIFLSIYNWRTFFLIYSSEDYVEMAKAKGLNSRDIERRYILRPTLPTIITSFALLLITLWTGAIITEGVFNWPGLGRTLFRAIGLYDTPVIVGSTIIYAYLLAITVFLLDVVYALVDPRVKVGGSSS